MGGKGGGAVGVLGTREHGVRRQYVFGNINHFMDQKAENEFGSEFLIATEEQAAPNPPPPPPLILLPPWKPSIIVLNSLESG